MPLHNSMCQDPMCWSMQWTRNVGGWIVAMFLVNFGQLCFSISNFFGGWQWSLDTVRFVLYYFEPRGVDIGWLLPMDYGQNITWDYKINE